MHLACPRRSRSGTNRCGLVGILVLTTTAVSTRQAGSPPYFGPQGCQEWRGLVPISCSSSPDTGLRRDPYEAADGEAFIDFDQVDIGQMDAAMGYRLAEGWLVACAVDVDVAAERVDVAALVESFLQSF